MMEMLRKVNMYKKLYRRILRFKMNQKNRKRLQNPTCSILSSNCIGGVIPHELGLRFNSPTVNLWIKPSDYLTILKNLKYYLFDCELIEDSVLTKEMGYPCGKLGSVTIYFQHYSNFSQAKVKWEERSKRVNLENLYIFMVERDGCSLEEIYEFSTLPFVNKVIFTTKNMDDIKCSYCIPRTTNSTGEVIDLCTYQTKYTGKRWIDEFDYVAFLNKRNKSN